MLFELIRNKSYYKLIFFVLLVLCPISGCLSANNTTTPEQEISPKELSPRAKSIYNYLKYQTLLNENKEKAALLALKNATQFDPNPQLFLERINYFMENNNPDKARIVLKEALDKYPEHNPLNLAQVKILLSQEKYSQAVEILQKFIQKDKSHLKFKELAGKLYLRKKKYAKALDILKKIPENKQTAPIHYLIASAYTSLDNQKKAISHLKSATEKDSSFIRAWAELAYLYEMNKDYVAAKKTYEKLLDKGKKNPRILIRLVDLNLKLNNPQQAMQIVDKAADNRKFFLQACGLFIQNNFFEHCQSILNRLEKRNSSQALFYRAIIAYQKEDNISKALEYLDLMDKESNLYKRSLLLKCRLLLAQEKEEKAQGLVQKGQELFPETEQFWILQSDIYLEKEKYTRAKQILEQGLKFNAQNTSILFQLGVVENKLNNTQKSISYMQKVINIDSEHAKALNFLGYTLAELEKDLERAKILIQKALDLQPENGYFLDSLAWVYYKSERYKKAWKTINKAIDKEEQDPIIWKHLGDIACKLDKKEQAVKAYKKALDLEIENPEKIEKKLNKLK